MTGPRDVSPTDPYYANWRELLRRGRHAAVAFLGFIVGSAASMFLFEAPVTARFGGLASLTLVLPWAAWWMIALAHRSAAACPRCGSSFFLRRGFRNPFARRCVNCGLAIWSPAKRAAMDSGDA